MINQLNQPLKHLLSGSTVPFAGWAESLELAQLSPLDDYARTKLMTMEQMPWSAQTENH